MRSQLEQEVLEIRSERGQFAERRLWFAAHSHSETVTRGEDRVIILHHSSDIYKLDFCSLRVRGYPFIFLSVNSKMTLIALSL